MVQPDFMRRLRARARRAILSRSGVLARTVLRQKRRRPAAPNGAIDIARDAGIGDIIMCTPGLRALKNQNPMRRIRFYTDFPELVRGLPYIDEVRTFAERPAAAIFVEYTDVVPSPVHIARLLGDRMGVAVRDTRPDCVVDPGEVQRYKDAWARLPRPWIVVLRRASRFTPNKDWPDASWAELLTRLCRTGTVLEIGMPDSAASPSQNYLDLRGNTSIPELVAAIAAADIYVGPVSGPMHIAAAVGTPAVVIIGGYEAEVNSHYAGNTSFYTKVPCAPCWLREPCPFDLKCLHAIAPVQVEAAIRGTWVKAAKEAVLF